ncbi:MAG: hypothetical protein JO279_04275 [Verrucomicrobia bacterium]|nr:hypothetical protein [Verrucomicrobiota bacterium]
MRRESYINSEVARFHGLIDVGQGKMCLVFLFLILAPFLRAQERVRSSVGQQPIQTFQRSPEAFFYLGPFQEIVTGSVGVEYTDNVDLTQTNKISDLKFFEALALNTTWVISHLNQLEFTFGGRVNENFYGDGKNQVNFEIAPDSKLEFKFSISDVQVRLYDNFSYTQNPTNDPVATNTANLNSLTNTIGAVVDTDLNVAVLSLAGDFTYNNQSGTTSGGQTNSSTSGTRETFRAGPALTFRLTPSILYGVDITATRSMGENAANVNSLNAGPFMKGKLGRNLEFDLSAGTTLLDTKPSVAPTYYFSIAARYRIDPHWQLVFSGSHELIFTSGTDLTKQNLFRLGTELDLTRVISFTLSPFINFGTVETSSAGSGTPTGPYKQFGIEAGLAWKPRKRWTTALTYDYIRRESSSTTGGTSSQNYIQNTVALSLSYAF